MAGPSPVSKGSTVVKIGVPNEITNPAFRVGVVPAGARSLAEREAVGATIVPDCVIRTDGFAPAHVSLPAALHLADKGFASVHPAESLLAPLWPRVGHVAQAVRTLRSAHGTTAFHRQLEVPRLSPPADTHISYLQPKYRRQNHH